jgi:hypothetical protein
LSSLPISNILAAMRRSPAPSVFRSLSFPGVLRVLGVLGLIAATTACSSGASDVLAPDFEQGQGQAKAGTTIYPAGPYGIGEGSVIANFEFLGFTNSTIARDPASLQGMRLGDLYNPHADDASYVPADADHDDRLFPPGSPYGAGTKKPTTLMIDVASVWCAPCNQEAKELLPPRHAIYKPCGGEFLLQLADGPTPGKAATPSNLVAWTKKYTVDFPAAIDPSSKLSALFKQDAFPSNLIVNTRTMKVVLAMVGEPDATFFAKFEETMNAAACVAGK